MTGQTQETLGRWAAEADSGRPLDINQEMSDLTMAIISETMFGTRVEADVQSIRQAIAHLLEYLNFRFEYPFYPGMRTPTLRNRQARRQLQILDNLIYSIIEKRRQGDDRPDDLLTILLNAQDEETGEVMSNQQLRDEVITIFVAGHETTAATLAWTFYLLSLNPQAESRLHAELDTELAGRTPTMADLPVLKYTRMVIDESMRLYPPAWITSRCRFYRRKYDAEKALAAFSQTVREELDVEGLSRALLTVVDETVNPESAVLWSRFPSDLVDGNLVSPKRGV